MAASTVFFFLRLGSFAERYKAALCFTGLVTFIAMYHYFRIFDSFNAAYTPCETINGTVNYAKCDPDLYGYSATGIPFNDAYRYVDWFLTVPLLLIEIVLVMKLSEAETFNRCVTLGVSSALMIANGYPGEITADPGTRWVFWALSMAPFTYIVYSLFVGLKASQDSQPEAVRDQVRSASRSATPSPTSSPSAASATSCTALACTSPCWRCSSATRSKHCLTQLPVPHSVSSSVKASVVALLRSTVQNPHVMPSHYNEAIIAQK